MIGRRTSGLIKREPSALGMDRTVADVYEDPAAMEAEIEAIFLGKTRDEWAELFVGSCAHSRQFQDPFSTIKVFLSRKKCVCDSSARSR